MENKKIYSSAREFLSYLQGSWAKYHLGELRNTTFSEITKKRIKEAGVSVPVPDQMLCKVVEDLSTQLVQDLEPLQKDRCIALIAAGSFRDYDVNARILRSPDGYFAIALNSGLMLLLSKFSKLTLAAANPQSVHFCDQGECSRLTSDDYMEMIAELFENYSQTGQPLGAKIHLAADLLPQHGHVLDVAESFIIAHEYAHFLNGDLNTHNMFDSSDDLPEILTFQNREGHEKEFKADLTGLRLVIRRLSRSGRLHAAAHVLFPLILVFDMIAAISDRESYTHPAPMQRLMKLASLFFGDEVANALVATYVDSNACADLEHSLERVSLEQLQSV